MRLLSSRAWLLIMISRCSLRRMALMPPRPLLQFKPRLPSQLLPLSQLLKLLSQLPNQFQMLLPSLLPTRPLSRPMLRKNKHQNPHLMPRRLTSRTSTLRPQSLTTPTLITSASLSTPTRARKRSRRKLRLLPLSSKRSRPLRFKIRNRLLRIRKKLLKKMMRSKLTSPSKRMTASHSMWRPRL